MSNHNVEKTVSELFARAIANAKQSRVKTIELIESYIRTFIEYATDCSVKDYVSATRIITLLEARLETIR